MFSNLWAEPAAALSRELVHVLGIGEDDLSCFDTQHVHANIEL